MLRKIKDFYQSVVEFIDKTFQEDLAKTVVVLLFFLVFFLFFKSSLVALFIGSIIAVLFFRWDSRIFFGVALLFLISCPILLILKDESWAEQMAIYTYYLLVAGVVVQVIEYAREQRKVIKIKSSSISWSAIILLLLVVAIGFYYLNNKFSAKLAAQDNIINRVGGYKVQEDDRELKKIKSQMQNVLDLLTVASDKKMNDIEAESQKISDIQISDSTNTISVISIDILNGNSVKGAAAALRDELSKKGYSVISIGNEPKTYINTVIKFNPGNEEKAKILQKELEGSYNTQLEQVADLKHDILIIIGAKKNG